MINQVTQALTVPTRREILYLIRSGEMTSTEIAAHFDISAPAISQHLKVLEKSGLVVIRKEGTKRYYNVRREGLKELKSFLDHFWEDSLLRLKEEAEKEERKKNGK